MEKTYYKVFSTESEEIIVLDFYGDALAAKNDGYTVFEVFECINSTDDTLITLTVERRL